MSKTRDRTPHPVLRPAGHRWQFPCSGNLGVTDIVMDSGGNGAGAWSAYCRRGGLNAHIYMTARAVQANQKECAIVGGDVNMCQGHTTILAAK